MLGGMTFENLVVRCGRRQAPEDDVVSRFCSPGLPLLGVGFRMYGKVASFDGVVVKVL